VNKIVLIFLVALSLNVFATKKKEHRHHESHVHGSATLNIAFDQLQGKVEFKSSSEAIIGFEHQAKSEKDKKVLNEAIAKFETGMASFVKFEDSLACVFTKEKLEMLHSGDHSDFIANFSVTCKTAIQGSKLTVDFSQFKGLKDLDVTLLAGELQKSFEVKRNPVSVEIK